MRWEREEKRKRRSHKRRGNKKRGNTAVSSVYLYVYLSSRLGLTQQHLLSLKKKI